MVRGVNWNLHIDEGWSSLQESMCKNIVKIEVWICDGG